MVELLNALDKTIIEYTTIPKMAFRNILITCTFTCLVCMSMSCKKASNTIDLLEVDDSYLKPNEELASNRDIKNEIIPDSAIDLGLSVRWSSVNLDATSPEQSGGYYAWGELGTKSISYNWSNYRWSVPYILGKHTYFASDLNKQYYLSKYNVKTYHGQVSATLLDSFDDVVSQTLGGNWRMPTRKEIGELITKCVWEWTSYNEIAGYRVTSKINGNSIFIPATGEIDYRELSGIGVMANLWSCSYNAEDPTRAYCLSFRHDEGSYYIRPDRCRERCNGLAIRPVWGKRMVVDTPSDILIAVFPNSLVKNYDWRLYASERLIQYAEVEYPGVNLVYGVDGNYTSNVLPNPMYTRISSDEVIYRVDWTYGSDERKNKSVLVQFVEDNGEWIIDNIGEGTTMFIDYSKSPKDPKTGQIHYDTCPEAIDLGLSVKWGSFNVGASKPYEYGEYYAWGETTTKKEYLDSNYKWWRIEDIKGPWSNVTYLKYYDGDNNTQLDLSDDVAHVKYGGKWRMPTAKEFNELASISWKWTDLNGVTGYLLTSTITGNSIFLPAAGFYSDHYSPKTGERGYYWSSEYTSGRPFPPVELSFTKYVERCYGDNYSRSYGLSVRAVWDDNLLIEVDSTNNPNSRRENGNNSIDTTETIRVLIDDDCTSQSSRIASVYSIDATEMKNDIKFNVIRWNVNYTCSFFDQWFSEKPGLLTDELRWTDGTNEQYGYYTFHRFNRTSYTCIFIRTSDTKGRDGYGENTVISKRDTPFASLRREGDYYVLDLREFKGYVPLYLPYSTKHNRKAWKKGAIIFEWFENE